MKKGFSFALVWRIEREEWKLRSNYLSVITYIRDKWNPHSEFTIFDLPKPRENS